jgi:hypothetical protein
MDVIVGWNDFHRNRFFSNTQQSNLVLREIESIKIRKRYDPGRG